MKQVFESDLVNIGNVTYLLRGECAINHYICVKVLLRSHNLLSHQ